MDGIAYLLTHFFSIFPFDRPDVFREIKREHWEERVTIIKISDKYITYPLASFLKTPYKVEEIWRMLAKKITQKITIKVPVS